MSGELEGLRVLVVEDDPIIALDVKATLERAGATVIGTAYRIAQALALLDTEFDVAVLDFRLEAETAQPVAAKLSPRGVPLLFYTSSRGHPQSLSGRAHHREASILGRSYRGSEALGAG
jgi:CheY-like chemotaxis protein